MNLAAMGDGSTAIAVPQWHGLKHHANESFVLAALIVLALVADKVSIN